MGVARDSAGGGTAGTGGATGAVAAEAREIIGFG
jgi:hypothetical protein